MPNSGYKGISFPFRITKQGGVATSTTSRNDQSHIEESIIQILGTNFLERVMESEIYSSVQSSLFEPNDESLQQVIKTQIIDSLERLEERIEVDDSGIELEVVTEDSGEYLYATITYLIVKYQTYYSTTVKVGEINE